MGRPKTRKSLDRTNQIEPQIPSNQKFYCCRCGLAFGRQKGNFPVSHSPLYRGTGYLPVCNDCADELFEYYQHELGSGRAAMRRLCMKFDLYWSDAIYDMVERSAGIYSKFRSYISKTNMVRFIDKNFDNTLAEEEKAGIKGPAKPDNPVSMQSLAAATVQDGYLPEEPEDEEIEVPEEVKLFWGPGYTNRMYMELEDRRRFWISRYPAGYNFDIGEEALIRQICNLEIDINHDRASGKSIDKNVNTLNTLLGSANLKPAQKKQDEADSDLDNMPFGVGIRRWENTRPVPEPDPELQDVDGIVKYITVWFFGHLCKLAGIKNSYCKLYEDEMEKLRVEAPEFEGEDDDTVIAERFGDGDDTE